MVRPINHAMRFLVLGLGLLTAAPTAEAADRAWRIPTGGTFSGGGNWNGPVPGASDTAGFGLSTPGIFGALPPYTVSFTADATNQALTVFDDRVTFDLNGHFYSATDPNVPMKLGTVSGASGGLAVTDGFVILPSRSDVQIATTSGGSGFLAVNTGGVVLGTPELFVGLNGNGALNVENGASIVASDAVIGLNSGATGTVTITGAGSLLNSVRFDFNSYFRVGDAGAGTLNISDGGIVITESRAHIARATGAGTVTVGGTGSNWTVRDELGVGVSNNFTLNGGAGTLTIQPGGTVDVASTITLGDGGIVNLDGGTLSAGSIDFLGAIKQFDWTSGTLHVGVYDGSLTVPNGGVLAPGRNGAGITAILQSYFSLAGSTTQIEIGGTAQNGTNSDFIGVGSSAILSGGNLQLRLINNFVPSSTDTFLILRSTNSIFGSYANIASGQRLPTSDGSGSFLVHYGAGSPFDVEEIVLSSFLPALPGDFDFDGDVDGRDFLLWQRGGSPSPLSGSDLADWQGNYGVGPLTAASVAVPEPSAFVLALLGICSLGPKQLSIRRL